MAVHLSYTVRILVAETSIGSFVVESIFANATSFVVWVRILVENIDSQRFDTEIVSESVSVIDLGYEEIPKGIMATYYLV